MIADEVMAVRSHRRVVLVSHWQVIPDQITLAKANSAYVQLGAGCAGRLRITFKRMFFMVFLTYNSHPLWLTLLR